MAAGSYILEPELESMPRDKLRKRQLELLKNTVERCYAKVDMYKEKFDKHGVKPSDIKTLDDIRKLPFTTKDDLRPRYPVNGVLAVPQEEVVRVHMTSGTTGKPTVSPFTVNDLELAYRMFRRYIAMAGGRKGDVFQSMVGYGMFLGGLIIGPALEGLGLRHIPVGSSVTSKRQIEFMQDFHPTLCVATPSFLLHIIEVAKEMGVDVSTLGLRGILEGAEACSQQTRENIMAIWKAPMYDVGGTCELFHFYHECPEHTGLHLAEDTLIFEILDPATDEPVGPGVPGELVVTSLCKDAMPLIRWRTRDITSYTEDQCACGRTSRQIDHFSGRVDDYIKIKGTGIYPSQIEEIIKGIPELADSEFQLVVIQSKTLSNDLTVRCEIPDALVADAPKFLKTIKDEVKNRIQVTIKTEMAKFGSLPRFTMKAQRVVGPMSAEEAKKILES